MDNKTICVFSQLNDNEQQTVNNKLDLASLVQKIEGAGKCPICMTLTKPPAVLCSSGHMMCRGCVVQISKCPLCNDPFVNETNSKVIRLITLDNILNELPRECDNNIYGCTSVFVAKHMLNVHKYVCEKRMVACRVVDCQWKDAFEKIKTHIKEVHESLLLTSISTIKINYVEDSYFVYPILLQDLLVWKHIRTNKNDLSILLESCAARSEQINAIVVYTIKSLKDNFKYTCTNNVQKEDDDIDLTSVYKASMTIPLRFLDHIKNNNSINYEFKIKKLNTVSSSCDSSTTKMVKNVFIYLAIILYIYFIAICPLGLK